MDNALNASALGRIEFCDLQHFSHQQNRMVIASDMQLDNICARDKSERQRMLESPPDIFTVDVEDWFHIMDVSSAPAIDCWSNQESRVARGVDCVLALLERHQVKATFFILGWVAKNHGELIRKIVAAGHEIVAAGHEAACHGYAHELVAKSLTPETFRADVRAGKKAVEDAAGVSVRGYRAPGFSVTKETDWVFEILVEEGFSFDSSVFPGTHGHGGIPDAPLAPYIIDTKAGPLAEFPMTHAEIAGKRIAFSGGGYLRLLPLWLIRFCPFG